MQREVSAPLHINLIIYTELLVPEPDVHAQDALLDVYDTQRSPPPWSDGARLLPLSDFFIGAHAAVANLTVLIRDSAGYATYFPHLAALAPGARGA